jgi:hypothetical protein
VYRVEGAGAAGDAAIAVNVMDETESAAAVMGTLEIAGQSLSAAEAAREPMEIWPWFVIAGLALLAIEWFLSAALMRS